MESVFTWSPIKDGLPDNKGIHMLTISDAPYWDEVDREEGRDVIIGVYEGDGKWRRRGFVYEAGEHVQAWAERPEPYIER